MKIKNKQQPGSFKGDDFVQGMFIHQTRLRPVQQPETPGQSDHLPIKPCQIRVFQGGIIHKVPLSTRVAVRPVISLAGKIDPFRVPEFIAHEIKIAIAGGGHSDQTDHFL